MIKLIKNIISIITFISITILTASTTSKIPWAPINSNFIAPINLIK